MTCDWCEEPIMSGVIQEWKLIGISETEEAEEFEFCCWTCLARWINA